MDFRELDRRSLLVLDGILTATAPADLSRPTPCAGWTLGDLLAHQIAENHRFAAIARHGSAEEQSPAEPGGADQAASRVYRAYRASVNDFLDAIADDGVLGRELVVGELGPLPGELAMQMHLVDTVAHGWDLARALDVPYRPDEEALQASLAMAEMVPADPDERRRQGFFGPVVPVPAQAPALDRFLALLGRDPAWAGTPAAR